MEFKKMASLAFKASVVLMIFNIILTVVSVVLPFLLVSANPYSIYDDTNPMNVLVYQILPIILFLSVMFTGLICFVFQVMMAYDAFKKSRILWAVGNFFIWLVAVIYYIVVWKKDSGSSGKKVVEKK